MDVHWSGKGRREEEEEEWQDKQGQNRSECVSVEHPAIGSCAR